MLLNYCCEFYFILTSSGDFGRALDRLRNAERNTVTISFSDIEAFSQPLAQVLLEDYYRVSPHLCSAVDEWLKRADVTVNRQLFVGISNVPIKIKYALILFLLEHRSFFLNLILILRFQNARIKW